MSGLVWEEPPPKMSSRAYASRWVEIAKALKESPGQWALVMESPVPCSNNTKACLGKYLPSGKVEVTQRTMPDRSFKCWARYIGDPS